MLSSPSLPSWEEIGPFIEAFERSYARKAAPTLRTCSPMPDLRTNWPCSASWCTPTSSMHGGAAPPAGPTSNCPPSRARRRPSRSVRCHLRGVAATAVRRRPSLARRVTAPAGRRDGRRRQIHSVESTSARTPKSSARRGPTHRLLRPTQLNGCHPRPVNAHEAKGPLNGGRMERSSWVFIRLLGLSQDMARRRPDTMSRSGWTR
jgi:hypothetical protein